MPTCSSRRHRCQASGPVIGPARRGPSSRLRSRWFAIPRKRNGRKSRGREGRGWSRSTVLRVGPCLFGLYTVVVYLYAELPRRFAGVRVVDWPGKQDVTFSDAITAVRRWLWQEWVFAIPGHRTAFSKLDAP